MTTAPCHRRCDFGQTSLLIVGLAVVVVMLVAVVVDASAAYLRRQGLDSLADGAALAAADGLQGQQVYEGGLGERALIDPRAAELFVAGYLNTVRAAQKYPGLSYSVEAAADRILVRVSAPLDLPLTPPGWKTRPMITGTAVCFVVVSD
jgi:hypothetical protein